MNIYPEFLRHQFPEYCDITVSEIFVIKYKEMLLNRSEINKTTEQILNKQRLQKLFSIDIAEFFERNEDKFLNDFINENSFEFNLINSNGIYSLTFHRETEHPKLFFMNDLENGYLSIKYNDEIFEFNKSNLDNIMCQLISYLKTNQSPETLLSAFVFGYLKCNTDLKSFFDIGILKNKITIETYYYTHFISLYELLFNDSNNRNTNNDNVIIECKNDSIYILDCNSDIIFNKEFKDITKNNFINKIIKPLKNILINLDNIREDNFHTVWEQNLYEYLLNAEYLNINENDFNNIKIEVFSPKDKSTFLNRKPHTTKPNMRASFLIHGNIVSYWNVSRAAQYNPYYQDLVDAYNIYRNLADTDLERVELGNIIGGEGRGGKVKRI